TLPIILLPMILLGGGMKPLHEMEAGARALGLLMPTRWALEANLSSEATHRGARFSHVSPCPPCAAPAPTPPPPAVGEEDVASTHFQDKNLRADSSKSCAYLIGMAGLWVAMLAGALKCRDIR